MADTKISGLTELTSAPAVDDEFVLVDKSDTTMGGTGTDKRIKGQTLVDQPMAKGVEGAPPTGVTYETFNRYGSKITNASAIVSGTLKMCGIWLPGGYSVTTISACSGTTALTTSGSGPHFWFGLFDSSRVPLRQSTDDTAATWAANSLKTATLTSAFVTTYTGFHYIGLAIHAGSTGTMPSVMTIGDDSSILAGIAPITHGNSSTGITGTAPNPAGAITVGTSKVWAGVA